MIKKTLRTALLGMLAANLHGASAPSGDIARLPDPIEYQRFREAITAARSNNIGLVQQQLGLLNAAREGSANWHARMAQQLLAVAFDAPREGRSGILPQLIAAAQTHYEIAFQMARSAGEKAGIKYQLGRLHERFTGDIPAAIAAYKDAASLNARDAQSARAAERLEKAETVARERSKR